MLLIHIMRLTHHIKNIAATWGGGEGGKGMLDRIKRSQSKREKKDNCWVLRVSGLSFTPYIQSSIQINSNTRNQSEC